MKYISADFKIQAPAELLQVARDLVADAAGEAGFESFEDTPEGLRGYVQDELFSEESLRQALAEMQLEGVTVTYTLNAIADQDWNQTWEEEGFEPITVANRLLVYDARHHSAADYDLSQKDLIAIGIEASNAFGTGTHETTRMMLSMLLSHAPRGARVLDCGCGTGILGIAAAKLGAEEVVGFDIDEWSVDNARHNAEINQVENLHVLHGDAQVLGHVSGVFNMVLANLNRNILLRDLPAYTACTASGALVAMSGFYEADAPTLLAKAAELGFHEVARQQCADWCCLLVQHE